MEGTKGLEQMVAAIQDATRREILFSFYADPTDRTVAEVAAGAGVHRSVVYTHLEKLVALGYLTSARRRGRPGKPAKLYRLAANPPTVQPPARHLVLLTAILGEAVQGLGTRGLAAAWQSASAAGRALAERVHDWEIALQPLRRIGDSFAVDSGHELRAERCAFRDICATRPEVMSTIHAALIQGVLQGSGIGVSVTPRSCGPAGCIFTVEPARSLAMSGAAPA